MKVKEYSWIYNTYNDNIYVLLVIIILLVIFINYFDYYKKKQDLNPNVTRTNILTNIKSSVV